MSTGSEFPIRLVLFDDSDKLEMIFAFFSSYYCYFIALTTPFHKLGDCFVTMPQPSDSNYVAVTRHRRPFARPAAGRPNILLVDDSDKFDDDQHFWTSVGASAWETDRLEDDDIPIARHEAIVAPLLEEGELDADAIVVSPTGNSSVAANNATERRRREEGWSDLALDQFINHATVHRPNQVSNAANARSGNNNNA